MKNIDKKLALFLIIIIPDNLNKFQSNFSVDDNFVVQAIAN
ncbi:hypothetical protein [Okeania sp. KiyG1]|nr:hypothetical protein [Okeania sp. KiyG1]